MSVKLKKNITCWFISVTCSTLVGPSVITLTASTPDPGRNFSLNTAISTGTSCGLLDGGDGPNTASPPGELDIHVVLVLCL